MRNFQDIETIYELEQEIAELEDELFLQKDLADAAINVLLNCKQDNDDNKYWQELQDAIIEAGYVL